MKTFVYFIRRADGMGPIKIGCSRSPTRRAYEMSFADRPKLAVIAAVEGVFGDENELHRRFASSRVIGEWFEPTPELVALIDEIKATGQPPSFFFAVAKAAQDEAA